MNSDNIENILCRLGKEGIPEDIRQIGHRSGDDFTKALRIIQSQYKHSVWPKFVVAAAFVMVFSLGLVIGWRWQPVTETVISDTKPLNYRQAAEADISGLEKDGFWYKKIYASFQPRSYPKHKSFSDMENLRQQYRQIREDRYHGQN